MTAEVLPSGDLEATDKRLHLRHLPLDPSCSWRSFRPPPETSGLPTDRRHPNHTT
ncbi:hypothetical protein [Streptomyces montanus]|uniref:hypothetical protein n=1 Tax=Streptomyces montanus TaxID=2580423 RepID=UPI001487216C|nr:hypothetical protein [Streptomyces montanus]